MQGSSKYCVLSYRGAPKAEFHAHHLHKCIIRHDHVPCRSRKHSQFQKCCINKPQKVSTSSAQGCLAGAHSKRAHAQNLTTQGFTLLKSSCNTWRGQIRARIYIPSERRHMLGVDMRGTPLSPATFGMKKPSPRTPHSKPSLALLPVIYPLLRGPWRLFRRLRRLLPCRLRRTVHPPKKGQNCTKNSNRAQL